MKTVFKIICYVVAGFFIYAVCLLGFTSMPQMSVRMKCGIMVGFSVPAIIALAIGLGLSTRRWRDVGIVFLSAGGFTLFLVGTMAVNLQDAEFRKLLPPEVQASFAAYGCGFGMIAAVLVIGAVCLTYGLRRVRAVEPPVQGQG
jgi:hypothetical protein